jgi:RNA binding exosome subunit
LSSKFPIAYIDVRAFAHATEDTDKVLKAIQNTLPTKLIETINVAKTSLEGHHGNPITLYETRIKEKTTTQKVFEKISANLGIMDKELLSNEIQLHLENGNLYLRLDKQSAYLEETKLSQIDPIRFRIHFKNSKTQQVIEICRKHGLLP